MAKQLSPFSRATRKAIPQAFCCACGQDLRLGGAHLDHAIPDSLTPLARAHGIDLADSANAQALCDICNGNKSDKIALCFAAADSERAAVLAAWARAMRIELRIVPVAKALALPDAYVNKVLAAQRAVARNIRCGK